MLAEWGVAGKSAWMRRLFALLLLPALALVPASCREQPKGALKAVVIGDAPRLRDPSLGPLPPSDSVLLASVAQGLVRFDSNGNIVPGLAERWIVSEDGLSYIFRIASAKWPDGEQITAQQVARLLKRQLAERSRNPLKDSLGAIEDVVAMTDRVIEIQLVAPRPTLLSILAQPELAILRGSRGTGPFVAISTGGRGGEVHLSRVISSGDEEQPQHEEVLLAAASASEAIKDFAASRNDLVLGGTFADLPLTRQAQLPRGALRFDPASGLFGLVPLRAGGPLDKPEIRQLLAQAIDRENLIAGLGVPGLAPRATLLEPGLDGMPQPVAPAWANTPLGDRVMALRSEAGKLLGKSTAPVSVFLPTGPGADLLFQDIQRDWGAIGLTVERSENLARADFVLIDEVAPSTSASWFIRRFRCDVAPICDPQADELMEAARQSPVPAQRYALLAQAATRVDDAQLFIPLTAPVRWSLVSARIQGFSGNRYARHTLTGLEQQPGSD